MTARVYPAVAATDGKPLNAMHDYVIRMSADELPPTDVFWSLTLYDLNNGFFIPNDQKKYSVGENAGMKLNEDGGIEVYVAAEKPEGVPEENWLPINRKDEDMDIVLRVYVADLEKMKTWTAPKAEKLDTEKSEKRGQDSLFRSRRARNAAQTGHPHVFEKLIFPRYPCCFSIIQMPHDFSHNHETLNYWVDQRK